MPKQKDRLGPAEVERLVAFIREFQAGRQVVPDEQEAADPPTTAASPAAQEVPDPPPSRSAREASDPAVTPVARPDPSPRPNPQADAMRSAAVLFQRTCRACHGSDGKGAALRAFLPELPDFTSPAWQKRRSPAQLTASILEGKGRQMPSFRESLSVEQARALAAFVGAFGPHRTDRAAVTADGFQERFSRLQQEFEQLRQAYRALSPQPHMSQAGHDLWETRTQ